MCVVVSLKCRLGNNFGLEFTISVAYITQEGSRIFNRHGTRKKKEVKKKENVFQHWSKYYIGAIKEKEQERMLRVATVFTGRCAH